MDPFVLQLQRLCAATPTRAKWVFVPSHALGRTLGDRLALEAGGWANLRFVTPLDVALRMGAPFLVEQGIDPSEEGLGPALVMRLLLEQPEGPGYFTPLAHQPQMAMALWATVRELRLAGVSSTALVPDVFDSPAKQQELRGLLERYEAFLHTTRRGDLATLFEEALRHPDWCPIQPADCWTEWPDAIWAPLPRRLIEAMPGERISPETWRLPAVTVPRRLAPSPATRVPADGAPPLAFLLAPAAQPALPRRQASGSPRGTAQLSLFSAEGTSEAGSRPHEPADVRGRFASLSFFHAGGVEAEIEEVFRRVLASGLRLDDVEIVAASPSCVATIWEKACRHDWPVTLSAGLPATLTRPGRALLGFTEWVEDDFAAGRLRRLLQSGDLALPAGLGLSEGRAAGLVVKAQAAWGRQTFALSLGRLAKSSRRRARRDDIAPDERERLERRAAEAEVLATWVDSLIAQVPAPDADRLIDLQALVGAAEHLVSDVASRASALDAAAATRLSQAIGELHALGSFRCSLGQGIRFLRERVEGLSVGADRPRPGHLHVSSLAQAAWSSRSAVFVVGLEEGRVFPAAFEDPVLLDTERERLDSGLARSGDRVDEAVYAAVSRLAAASARSDGQVCLSYSCRDLREFRETHASWLLLQAFRVSQRNPGATYRDLKQALGDPVSCVPAQPSPVLSPGRWWLHGMVRAGQSGRASVLDAYPPLAAGLAAAAARSSSAFTEFDGHVPEAGRLLDPARSDRVVSPTELEEAASCPFRYFLRRGLRIDALDTGERDREVWLDPLTRGSILHDLYASLMRRCRADDRRCDMAVDGPWLRQRGEATLAALRREMPPASVEVDERESRELLADLALFVEAECQVPADRTAVGFEVGFGRAHGSEDDEREPLSRAEPIEIALGRGRAMRVAGRIDRIDRVSPREFEIVDYKTGRYWDALWQGTFDGGRRLQHALYGLAAASLLRARHPQATVSSAEYYFPSAKGWQRRVRIQAPPLASTTQVLADLRDVIAGGLFVHAVEHDRDCKFCDFGAACGRRAHEEAAPKLPDPLLEPYRRLSGHE